MPAALRQQLQLGADAVGGGDQERLLEARLAQVEQAAEAAELGGGARPGGRAGERPDRLDQGLAGLDVDPGLPIAIRVERLQRLLCHGRGLG